MPRPVVVRLTRDFPVPLDAAYAWLTDFQDDDARIAGAVVTARRVVERSPRRIVYEGESEAFGRRIPATTEVDLLPPDAWEARVVKGPRTGSVTRYALAPRGSGTRLTVEYRFLHEKPGTLRLMRLLKPLLRRNLVRMWDGYAAAMRKELGAPHPSTGHS